MSPCLPIEPDSENWDVKDETPGPVTLIVRLTWLDFIRRKDLYVVGIFMLLFVLATAVIRILSSERGMDEASARFLMSGGLTLSHVLAAFLAASFCGRAFPEEFERGTLMPLLAKPITRGEVLAGKLSGCLGLVLGGYAAFVGLTLLAVPTVEGQRFGALFQVAVLHCIGLSLLGVFTMALSLYLPTLVAAPVGLCWYFGAGFLFNLFDGRLAPALERVAACLPDPTLLNHVESFAASGAGLEKGLFWGLAVYGLAWGAMAFYWALWRLERIRL